MIKELRLEVDAAGSGKEGFATLGAALAHAAAKAATEGGVERTIIDCAPGTYREKLAVSLGGVTLRGPDPGPGNAPLVHLVWGDAAGHAGPDGSPLGTFRTQTLAVLAPDFRAEHIRVANDWDYPGHEALPPDSSLRIQGTQAVAVKTDGMADRTVFLGCWLDGYQDTLYCNAGRHVFHGCRISGHVDYIFGAGQAVFLDCDLVCLGRDVEEGEVEGYVCAPSTRPDRTHGFLFKACRVVEGDPRPATGSFALGRPWHPSFAPDTINSALFRECWLGPHIMADAWTSMNSRPGGVLTTYQPEDAQLFEYRSEGPGAAVKPSSRRRFLDEGAALAWEAGKVTGGWWPEGVPGP